MDEPEMIDVNLARIVIREGADRQYIYLVERDGTRGFPIVIGNNEASEISRVVHRVDVERPMTHQLALNSIQALGASIRHVDIVRLMHNTYYARVVLSDAAGKEIAVDARPSDAIALALRARCGIRVAEPVLQQACSDEPPG